MREPEREPTLLDSEEDYIRLKQHHQWLSEREHERSTRNYERQQRAQRANQKKLRWRRAQAFQLFWITSAILLVIALVILGLYIAFL